MQLLDEIVALSHYFGAATYVKGGGGNTSVKDEKTLWIKPSGTTLGGLCAAQFIPLDRDKLAEITTADLPAAVEAREKAVKSILAAAARQGATGRPSVETSLHNAFSAKFVVHTHPPMVNGMTCCQNGKAICQRLFPQSLWIDYTDPGYVLFKKVYDEIRAYQAKNTVEPTMVFLENHGVFVAGDTEAAIKKTYEEILATLRGECEKKAIPLTLQEEPPPAKAAQTDLIKTLCHGEVVSGGKFTVPAGPLTPDHIVYAKSFAFSGSLDAAAIAGFKRQHGYAPAIIAGDDAVYAVGSDVKRAALALTLAQDGALVAQLAAGLGGVKYMSDKAREFIENWEVEAYRSKMLES